MNKKNFIFGVSILINIAFEYKNDFCIYATLTKKTDQNENIIIFDQDGWIEGFSESLGKVLKINENEAKLLNKIGNINFFLPQLNQFKKTNNYPDVKCKKNKDKFILKNQNMYFYFPININNYFEELSVILSSNESFIRKSKTSKYNTLMEYTIFQKFYKNSTFESNQALNNFHEKNLNQGLLNVFKVNISLDEQNYLLSDYKTYFTSNILDLKEFTMTNLKKIMDENTYKFFLYNFKSINLFLKNDKL